MHYCTARLMLLLCVKVPDVAVTVTDDEKGWKLPPQPFAVITATARARSMKMPSRFLRRRMPGPIRQYASASPLPLAPSSIAV